MKKPLRYLAAIIVCAVEIALYAVVLMLLTTSPNDLDRNPLKGDPITRILKLAPLVALAGLTWTKITGNNVLASCDPFGIIPRGKPNARDQQKPKNPPN